MNSKPVHPRNRISPRILRAEAPKLSDALLTRLLADPEVTPESRVILEAEASRRSESVAS